MSKFLTELKVKLKTDCDDVWILLAPLGYCSDIIKQEIWVPVKFEPTEDTTIDKSLMGNKKSDDALFETDFASVPRVPIAYDMFGNRAHYESVIHDYLYCKNSCPVVERSVADDIFFEAMKCRGKNWFVRYAMYAGVRLGGWTAYHKRNVEDKI